MSFGTDASVDSANNIGASLELDGTPVTYAVSSLNKTDADNERLVLTAIVDVTGTQALTVKNTTGNNENMTNSVLNVVKLSKRSDLREIIFLPCQNRETWGIMCLL